MATLAASASGADELAPGLGEPEDGLGIDVGVLTIEGCSSTDLVSRIRLTAVRDL